MIRKIFSATLVALMVLVPSVSQAKVEHLLPRPQQVTVTEGGAAFKLSRNVTINYSDGVAKCELLEEFFTDNGCEIASSGASVNVSLVESIEGAHDYELHGYENEAYTLEITANEINITAVTPTGIIRAAQTLTQLAEGYEGAAALEALTMKDWPAFKLRGYMHDVGRSFISIDELVKQVELFSRFKVNTFHWHMTENQAWRFEVKAYPALTSGESMTRFPGKYYTQEDCKRLMAVAKKHGVIVIPEIDMPGHSEAFERAMGFGMQTEEGKVVLKKVLDEVCEVFADAPYIHIGGDEVATTAAYLNEMIAYVESKGKKAELWNPINGIGQDALNHTLAQMWGTRGYLASGKANIDCRYNYTNHFDVFADLVGIYKSNIYYHDKGTSEVAGAVSGCWNDRKVADEVQIMAQNNVWANVIATAERAWIGGGKQYIDNMTNTPANLKVDGGHGGVMLPNSGEEFEEFASWERRFLFHKANSLENEPIPYVKQTNVRWRITDAFPNNGNSGMSFAPEAAGTSADANLIAESFVHEGKTYYTGMATGAGIYLSHTWGNSIIDAYYSNPQFNHTAYAWTFVYSEKEQTVGAQIEFQNYSRSEQDGAAPNGQWDHFGSRVWLNGEEIPAPVYENTGVGISSKEVMLKNENFPAREPIEVTLKQGWNKVFLKLPYMNTGYRLKKWMFTFVLTDLEGKNAVDGLIYSPNQCMDEATESVASKISEIKRDRGAFIGTAVGLWPESLAATLDAKVADVEATYSANKTAEERAAQVVELEDAWAVFEASLTEANMNKPVSGNYYRMFTPLRGNRYATGNGADAAVTGPDTAGSKASIWQFVTRTDGAYNIINLADGTYLSPASNNNAALKTVALEPNAGWSIKKAATSGLVIVVSGSVQFNQQKDGNLYLLNWGSGTNTTDDGCQYLFVDVTASVPPQPFAKVDDVWGKDYPYVVDNAIAAKVFSKENLTIAVDVTMPASLNGRGALVCAADPTQAITGATKTNSPYIAYGHYGVNPAYLASSRDGDRFTYREFSFSASTRYKVVYVIDKTDKKLYIYVNGELKSTGRYPDSGYELQSFSNFATNSNAGLYIGGGAVNNNAQYDKFAGSVHSVQFFDGVLPAEQVAEIEYPVTEADAILTAAEEANANMDIYGMQRFYGLVQDAGTGIAGDGQFVCNYPAATSQENGNAYANLIDGSYTTFFHSGYGNTIGTGSHYLQTNLDEPVKKFRFYFKKRSQNDTNRPTKITVEGSNDGEAWSEIAVISSGLPTNASVLDYYSDLISSSTAYSKIRFTVNTTNGGTVFYTFSEFYILPNNSKVEETFNAVRSYRAGVTLENARAINEAYAWNKGLTKGEPIVGKEHYVYVDTYKDGAFLNRYLYNNNGTLTLTTDLQKETDAYIWTAAVSSDGKYNFKNKAGKYLAHKGMSDNEHNFTVAPTTHHRGVTLHTQGSNYFVVKNADGGFDQSSITYDQTTTNLCTDFVFVPVDAYNVFSSREIARPEDFVNGEIYTFVSARGWMGAKADNANVISTVYTSNGVTGSAADPYFQWTVYKSANGKFYLYNLGKQMFMGVQKANNAAVPFVAKPAGSDLTFKVSSSAEYPIMFSTDNNGVINHSPNHNPGLINWTGGWNKLDDEGSNHKVTCAGILDEETLASIEAIVANVEAKISFETEVEGWTLENQNTHFGGITINVGAGNRKVTFTTQRADAVVMADFSEEIALSFTRKYRGFDFVGFYLGEENLGENPTLTAEQKTAITAGTPVTVKFKTDGTKDVTLFYDDDPKSYRIPAIATTGTGRLIAVSDYRYSLDDIGRDNHGTGSHRIDLVIRTSDDNGATWSGIQTIAQGTDVRGANDCAYGDAAIAAVGEKVLVMAAAGDVVYGGGSATAHNRMVRLFSEDNGVTWSKEDISDKVFIGGNAMVQNGYTAFFGSGKLAVDANYNNTGNPRIYGAILIKNSSRSDNNYVIYSDDFGATWSILGGSQDPIARADEPKVEILPSGQILLSTRRGGGRKFNVFTYTDKSTNAGTWNGAVDGCGNGGSNTTNGEIFCVDAKNSAGDNVKLLLQSQPKGGSGLYDRKNVTIWYKEITAQEYTSSDIAANWIEGKQVSTQLSAYSTMSLQKDGKIAFFFEEAPCYGDDYTKGYSMVYVPLTIEAITKANYYSKDANLNDVKTVKVVLTDANGNEYHETVEAALVGIADAIKAKYSYITLGDNPGFDINGDKVIYTNTVTLPFEVSNAATTVWHNIYWPSNDNNAGYPVYMSASSASDEFVPKVTENQVYGNSSYNTLGNNDKISWAVYNVGNGFSFKFKNKLTNKFIQATSVANGNAQNVKYVDEANATAFTLLPDAASNLGDYALVASVGETTGYLCSTSAGYGFATHYNGNGHQGAWVKFAAVPDFTALIAEVNDVLAMIGTGVGKYSITEANVETCETAKTAMQNSNSVKLNDLNTYKALLEGATLNMPEPGRYYRIAYDYGGNVGKLYMQSTASSVKGLQFAAEQGAGSIWCYNDGGLLSYTKGLYIKESGDFRGLQPVGTKQAVEFSASTRAKGKYCIKPGAFLHANAGNGNYYTDHCSSNSCAQHDFLIEEVESLPVTVTAAKYATLYAPVALSVPVGLKAYTVIVNGEWATLNEITSGVIPANTGVVLVGNEGSYNFAVTTADATVDSDLRGSVATTYYTEPGTYYALGQVEGEVGFYKDEFKNNHFQNNSHKAYLYVPETSNVSFYGFRFGDEEGTTAVENVEVVTENVIFDLTGRRISEITGKGIYIIGGKKFLVK